MMQPKARNSLAVLAISGAALVTLLMNEGYTDKAVIPVPGDVPTIGFGTTENVHLGDTTTPPKALQRALSDISKYEGAIKKCVIVPLTQNEYDAYVDLAYNIGTSAFCGSTLVKKLNSGDYESACREIAKWDKFKGKSLPGLTSRRAKEQALCLQGIAS